MSELKAKYLDRVVCIRNGSSDDGEYGLVTHVTEADTVILTVTFFIMESVRHTNYYGVDDVEITDKEWRENLPPDPQVRCVLDKRYTRLYFICDGRGRNPTGYGTPGIAWSHWLREHDEATAALHLLVQEVQDDRTSAQDLEEAKETIADGGSKGNEGQPDDVEDLGRKCRSAK